jgi:hypothetical protein
MYICLSALLEQALIHGLFALALGKVSDNALKFARQSSLCYASGNNHSEIT